MKNEIIAQGAEAKIILEKKNKLVLKNRIKKSYRLEILDEKIRKQRSRAEFKILEKSSKIIPVPSNLKFNEQKKEISMEFIDGKKLSQHLGSFSEKEQEKIMSQIGDSIAKIHDAGIIHGDLTTSNIIYVSSISKAKKNLKNSSKISYSKRVEKSSEAEFEAINYEQDEGIVYIIDFGLGFQNGKIEDKAVDIHLLRQALEAKHFKNWKDLFDEFIKGYSTSKESKKVIERFNIVERRGRYKDKY